MRSVKKAAGILLMAAALVMMIFWEAAGREAVLYKDVVTAALPIEKGTALTWDMIKTEKVPAHLLVEGGLSEEMVSEYLGKKANIRIPEGLPLSSLWFYQDKELMPQGSSIYVIPSEWIFSMSSSLRKGDTVTLLGRQPSEADYGDYEVAFVKDQQGREVTELSGLSQERPLSRTEPSAPPASMEIIATKQQYSRLAAAASGGETFTAVHKEEIYEEAIR